MRPLASRSLRAVTLSLEDVAQTELGEPAGPAITIESGAAEP
jgi:hypothetical protein